jgi:hypothetical protein
MPKFDDHLYDIDFRRLSIWICTARLRNPTMAEWLAGMVTPLYARHRALLSYRARYLYWHYITPQVCSVERMLNDAYDTVLRRIRIVDGIERQPMILNTKPEGTLVELYTKPEDNPAILYTRGEIGAFSYDFIVEIPLGMPYVESEMRALINRKKPLEKNYIINIV